MKIFPNAVKYLNNLVAHNYIQLSKTQSEKIENLKTLSISISGMHCEGCGQTVEKALLKNKGIRNVKVDTNGNIAHIEFKDGEKVNIEQIRHKIRQVGFIPGVEEIGK